MNDSTMSALGNWIWLADMPYMRDVLIVGESPFNALIGLEQHFERLRTHLLTQAGEAKLPFHRESFDCVVFDEVLGEALVSDTGSASVDFLGQARRVLRSEGCLVLPVAQLQNRRPRALAKPLRRAGFAKIRSIYVHESLDRPTSFIPASRRTATFYETWALGGIRGKVKAAIALTGAHHLLQPSLVFLAYL